MALGTAVRCISINETFFTWMAHTGANFNGIAGIVMCAVPPALSSLWKAHYKFKIVCASCFIFIVYSNV